MSLTSFTERFHAGTLGQCVPNATLHTARPGISSDGELPSSGTSHSSARLSRRLRKDTLEQHPGNEATNIKVVRHQGIKARKLEGRSKLLQEVHDIH
ncbi:hypothetical protein MTO96_039091 [Rhipicephalus appendiculatus]